MESMQLVRGQVSSIVDIDFFLNEAGLNTNYEDDHIAQVIKGAVYERTKRRVNDFISRCHQTLAGLQQRVDQTESEFQSLVSQANSERPGSGPSTVFVDRKNPNSVARYNEKVERHNHQVELHRRLIDQANRAKERHEDAVEKFNEKKADLEEQIREKLEELKPALDQDILTLLGKLQQLAYDSIRNQSNLFAGFLLSYLAKKAYVFLYDRIGNTNEQRAAIDIFKKLNDELDTIMSSDGNSVRAGLSQTAEFLCQCHEMNAAIHKGIQEKLQGLPYQECKETAAEVRQLLAVPSDTTFAYKHIIDPAELAKVEEQVQARNAMLQRHLKSLHAFTSRFDPTFDSIAVIRDSAHSELAKMNENKTGILDPVGRDTFFTLGIFDDEDQERYMKKHKPWLQNVQKEIEQALHIDLKELVRTIARTELLTKTTKEMLAADEALLFHSNKEQLSRKKQQMLDAVKVLDAILQDINELPKQKSAEFTRKMSLLLYLSLLPVVNVGVIFAIIAMVREYLPALKSSNSAYVELKQAHIKKYQTYFYVHIALAVVSVIASFFCGVAAQPALLAAAGTYIPSIGVLYAKEKQLTSLERSEGRQ
ncbi:MAG TPA: hypothetical protein VI685_21075 [Candidatus Angelobacter sp.]